MTEEQQGDDVEDRERSRVTAAEVSWALREVTRAAVDVDVALAHRMRLRTLDYAAITHLMNEPGVLGPVELSSRLGISTGSGTELVDRLERAGHLRRQRHAQDRRRVVLHVTESAVGEVIGELTPLFADLDDLAGALTPDDQALVARYLRAAAQRVRGHALRLSGPGPAG